MKKIKKLIPIYNQLVTVVYCDSVDKINNDLGIEMEEHFTAVVFDKEVGHWCVVVRPKHLSPGIVAHECKHLVNKLFVYVGIELDRFNDEAECYMIKWFVDLIYKHLPK